MIKKIIKVFKNKKFKYLNTKTKNYKGILYSEYTNASHEKAIKIKGLDSTVIDLVVPDKINGLSVEEIGKNAFKNNKNIRKIVLSNSITKIGSFAFSGCSNLEEVALSCNIKTIKKYCFYNCTSLKKIAIPFELRKIEQSAFENCYSLTDVFHYLKTRHGKVKVFNKAVQDKHLPIKLISIGKNSFANCKNLESIYIPYKVNKIEKGTFKNCEKLKLVPLHNNIHIIKSYAFLGCKNLKTIKLPSNIEYIGTKSFDKKTKISYYNSSNSKIRKSISKFNNEIIGDKDLNLDSRMIPGNTNSFYNKNELKKAIDRYELRNTFDQIITRTNKECYGEKSKFKLSSDTYIYDNKKEKDTATIMMTGDVMCRAYQIKKALKDNIYSFDYSFSDIKKIIKNSDLAICNLETSVSKSIPYSTEKSYIDDMIHLNAPSEFLKSIRNAGFDMVVNSNNHIYDTGTLGIFETLDAINKNQLIHTGVFASESDKRFVNVVVNGINIGIISYCNQNYQLNKKANFSSEGINTLFSNFYENQIKNDINNAKKNGAEFIIAYCHWGNEYTANTTFNQRKFAKMVANAGADYLLGSHSHCLQHYSIITTEDNRKVPCLYSAGNFISDMAVKLPEVRDTLILELKLFRDKSGKVKIEKEGYYPCIIRTDDNYIGGTKTFLLQDLINNCQSDEKYELYRDIARIKNTIGDNERLELFINDEVKDSIKDFPVTQVLKKNQTKKKKSLKTRLLRKIKKVIKQKIYAQRHRLTLEKICNICEIDIPKNFKKYKKKKISHICTSTKTLKPNSILFTNIKKGFSSSQLELIRDNCSFVICSEPIKNCRCIIVDHPIKDAVKIFNYIKSLKKITTIAVTGSVGKTSTKEMIEKVLYEKYRKKLVASKGNSNVIFRIANNILKLNYNTKVFLQEVGIGKTNGNMKIMAQMLEPDIVVYTNIKDAHIEGYGSRENIFKEKSDLSNYANKNGLVLINYDDEILRNQKFDQKTLSFSLNNPSADYYAKDIKSLNEKTLFTIVDNIENKTLFAEILVLGDHNVINALTAYAIGKYLNINESTILNGLKNYRPSNGRQQLLDCGKYKVLADCYNSSYDGIKSILQTVDLIKINNNGKKIAVIGDIFELGEHSEKIHRLVGNLISDFKLDKVIFYGDLVKFSYEEYKKTNNNGTYFSSRKEVLNYIKENIKEDDLILFKASHGMYYYNLIDSLFGTEIGEISAIYDKKYSENQNNDFVYNVYDYNITLTKCLQSKQKLELPDSIVNLPVEKLSKNLFKDNTTIREVKLPQDLIRIGDSCFEKSNIEKIKFNNNLKRICKKAFYSCNNIEKITLPEDLLVIESNAFANCKNLKEIYISNQVQNIDDSSFNESDKVTILCEENSYAIKFAERNNIKYKTIDKNNSL